MPWSEGNRHRRDDMQDLYAGPEDFMEAGVRGFLITCVPDKEELAVDQAMKMLRKACVKLYGGIKPIKSNTALFSSGYIALDFMDAKDVTVLPNPDTNTENAESQQQKETEEGTPMENEDTAKEADAPDKTEEDKENAETEIKEETEKTEDLTESTQEETKMETQEEGAVQEQADEKEAGKDESSEDAAKSKSEAGDDADKEKGDAKSKTDSQKSKSKKEESKSSSRESRESRDQKRKRKHEESTPKWPLMRPVYKFKAYRTELRNILFIKSNVPDPLLVVQEVMQLIVKRKPLKGYAIYQLLPIQGVCSYSFWEVEVMCKRILAPFFPEDLENPPSFGILMFDKLVDPGAENLAEIVRSAIWSLNPCSWQSHPMCEPDFTIHLELIGSRIVLSVLPDFMKYRQYSPFVVTELGEGKPDSQGLNDDIKGDGTAKKEKTDSSKDESKGKSKSQSTKSQKKEDSSSGKKEEKESQDKANDEEKDSTKTSDKEEQSTEEVAEKQEVKEDEGETAKDEMEESPKKEDKKTPQKKGGKRAASQKKK